MSEQPRTNTQFYLTAPAPCPYLEGRTEQKVFTHLVGKAASDLHDVLAENGFRRSQTICYKPVCADCRACVSVRIPVKEFRISRNQRRLMQKNEDIVGDMGPLHPTSEQFALFRNYLVARHARGGMTDMSMYDYMQMVEDSQVYTALTEYRIADLDSLITGRSRGRLMAVALTDLLKDGLSMVYAFYDPEETRRSLGTMMILDHIARARALGLTYLYLGYWVKGSAQMDYKSRFRPLEWLDDGQWRRFEQWQD